MNQQSDLSSYQQQVIDYLYGEISDFERSKFEQQLRKNSKLQDMVEQQQQLDKLIPSGVRPVIDEQRTSALHWSLQKKLRQSLLPKRSFFGWFKTLWQSQFSFKFQLASMILTFTLGVIVTNAMQAPAAGALITEEGQSRVLPLAMIGNDDFEIIDLQYSRSDSNSDEINVKYSLVSETQVKGSLSSQKIQELIGATLRNDVNDATRLDLIELLTNYSQSQQARETLSHSLLNDPNPGVRMFAAQSLAKLAKDANVRRVLQRALAQDVNAGIRVEAFEALLEYVDDPETLEIFKNFSTNDSNPYIRSQAKSLIESRQPTATTNI